MLKTIKNIKAVLDFLKDCKTEIRLFKSNLADFTPVLEKFKTMVKKLEF